MLNQLFKVCHHLWSLLYVKSTIILLRCSQCYVSVMFWSLVYIFIIVCGPFVFKEWCFHSASNNDVSGLAIRTIYFGNCTLSFVCLFSEYLNSKIQTTYNNHVEKRKNRKHPTLKLFVSGAHHRVIDTHTAIRFLWKQCHVVVFMHLINIVNLM